MSQIEELISAKGFDNLSPPEALKHVGLLIDASNDLNNEKGLRRALVLSEAIRSRLIGAVDIATLDYFEANAWSGIRKISRPEAGDIWEWENLEFENEIICLRRAVLCEQIEEMQPDRVCQIFTNLGNALSNIGRFVEALQYWDAALAIGPEFSMALGNRAVGLESYGRALYDEGHAAVFFKQAHRDLSAISTDVEPHATSSFDSMRRKIESSMNPEYLAADFSFRRVSLGRTKTERRYRQWCLENRLFLNPLNDISIWPVATHDVLSTPSIVTPIGEGPYHHGFFNQMKQEFVSARYLLYSGLANEDAHFSDREVLLLDTLDYPLYGIAIEKVKCAFRLAYSLFDKIAYFLNDYIKLGLRERQVSFRTIWYNKCNRSKGLREIFERRANWPLRGLFWVSKDLYEDKSGFRDAIEPMAREIQEIRNHLEHKYLKVHEYLGSAQPDENDQMSRLFFDTLAYSVTLERLEAITMSLFRLARASLIYLSLGIEAEERMRARERDPDALVPPIFLEKIEDDWKRKDL